MCILYGTKFYSVLKCCTKKMQSTSAQKEGSALRINLYIVYTNSTVEQFLEFLVTYSACIDNGYIPILL